MRIYRVLAAGFMAWSVAVYPAAAEVHPVDHSALVSLAQQFVARVSKGFNQADQSLGIATSKNGDNILGEGETLLFNVRLGKKLNLDGTVMGEMRNRHLLLSLRDLVDTLVFPISVKPDGSGASGWYIREAKVFTLDMAARTVKTDHGNFTLSSSVVADNGDILAPPAEIATWFNLEVSPDPGELLLSLKSATPLPVEEKMARQGRRRNDTRIGPPVLPYQEDPAKAYDVPFVDVSTSTTFKKDGNSGNSHTRRTASVATAGDLAYGTLTTQTLLNDDEKLSSMRATYKRESLDPELLGPLKARKYELGDITTPNQPLTNSIGQGFGAHVTNIHPLRATIDSTTTITGSAQVGWDVELYRDDQLLDTQSVNENGVYAFTDVTLFLNENNFRVVLYGPQGQVQEEKVYLPVDPKRLAEEGSAYDVTLTLDNTQTYRKREYDDPDNGKPRVTARYEKPIGNSSALQLGIEAGQDQGKAETIGHVGASTTLGGALLNANTAFDQDGEAAAELVARRNFGKHELSNTIAWATEAFNLTANQTDRQIFSDKLQLSGPFDALPIGNRPRYNMALNYGERASGDTRTDVTVGASTGLRRMSVSQQFRYTQSDADQDPQHFNSITAFNGSIDRTRLRLTTDVEMLPHPGLQTIDGNIARPINDEIDGELNLNREMDHGLTTARAQLNWDTKLGRLSPSLSYNSEGDVTAMLNSNFSALRDPQSEKMRVFNRPITYSGGLSAFVFLDKNGNGVQDDGEEPIEGAVVMSLQNGGRATTDTTGYAFFNRLQSLRLTDVSLDPSSLPDPYWVPATAGNSILPREGHVTQMVFPVVKAAEIDGRIYGRRADGGASQPLRNVTVALFKPDGTKLLDAMSEDDGFYLLSPIPPGNYTMIVGNPDMRNDQFIRPQPKALKIGFDGPIIRNNDIYMEAGLDDAPVRVLASVDNLAAADPGFNPDSIKNENVVLNLGTYNSRLLMGVVWYKVRSLHKDVVAGLNTLVDPSKSYAAVKTGRHTLRIGSTALSLGDAYKRCGLLNAEGIACTVEILPGGLQLAKL